MFVFHLNLTPLNRIRINNSLIFWPSSTLFHPFRNGSILKNSSFLQTFAVNFVLIFLNLNFVKLSCYDEHDPQIIGPTIAAQHFHSV